MSRALFGIPSLAEMQRLGQIAAKKLAARGGWKREKPTKPGLWFGAKWQNAGFYHVQRYQRQVGRRYVNFSVRYVRAQNDDFFAGPFTERESRSAWIRHLPRPLIQETLCH